MPGGSHFQPSEWVKLILILAMAKYFSEPRGHEQEGKPSDIIKAGLLVGVPMLLVLAQPDLGTALTYVPIAIMGLFLGGLKLKHAVALLLLGVALAVPVWKWGLKPYQKDRLTSFMEPEADPQKNGLPGDPIADCGGLRRLDGKGDCQGFANARTIPARSPYRLYLCRMERRTRLSRRIGRFTAILYGADASDPERADGD